MANFVAVYDACVLYPAPLRDLEWMRSVQRDRPELAPEKLQRTRELMDSAVPDCLVTGHESLIEQLHLPDPNDRHVLAATIRCQAGVIVTYNLADFPVETIAAHGIEAQHPDEFVMHLHDLAPGAVARLEGMQDLL